jgi:hypothetical protein
MRQAAARNAALRVSSLAADIAMVGVAGAIKIAHHARCIAPPAPVVVRRPRCLFSRETTDRCIAVIVTNRSVLVARTSAGRAGNTQD